MATTQLKGPYTYRDYAARPAAEKWELIDGVLYRMAAGASTRHQDVGANLGNLLDNHLRPRHLGRLFRPRYDLILPGATAVEPDLMFVSAARRHFVTARACEGPPDLVVEILSPATARHDLERKRELYARHGIPEYWILEPWRETLLRLTDPYARAGVGDYRTATCYRPGATLTTPVIPGLALAVADLFADPW